MNSNEQGLKGLKLKNILECLFFVASEPLSTKQLATICEYPEQEIEDTIKGLAAE